MHILLIHQFYLRPGQGGGSRFNEMARLWRARGHEVTVIAGQVDYASGYKPVARRGEWAHRERGAHGEQVWRLYTPNSYQKGVWGRALATGGFACGASVASVMIGDDVDVVIVTSPPLTLGVVPALVRRLRRVPVVFEVRDLWPDSALATGALRQGSWVLKGLYLLESFAYREATRVVALTPAIAQSIERRGLKSDVVQIPNGADAQMMAPLVTQTQREVWREEFGWSGKFVVLYAGAHGAANDLMQWVEAATLTRDEPIVWVAVGDGPQKQMLCEETRRRGLVHVEWRDAVSRHEIQRYFDAADCGAAVLRRAETFKTVYPNKIFDAMSRGRAVLCGVDGAARELVEGYGAGVFFEPEDAHSMVAAVRQLMTDAPATRAMGSAGRALVEAHFTREALAARYLDLLEQMSGTRDEIASDS